MVKDYDCEILYHSGKPNMVVDALSLKVVSAPIWDLCLIMIVVVPILEMIRDTQSEDIKGENRKSE